MVSGGAKAFGRLAFGKLVGYKCLRPAVMHQMALIISGAGYLTLPVVQSLPVLLAFMMTIGFVEGCSAVLMPSLLTAAVGEQSRIFGWGFLCCCNSISFMIGSPMAGKPFAVFISNYICMK